MPEIAIDENSDFRASEDDVRTPGQIGRMGLELNALFRQPSADQAFRLRTLATDACHEGAALRSVHYVAAMPALGGLIFR